MRHENDVSQFEEEARDRYGHDSARTKYLVKCYEACIPRKYWRITPEDVTHNRAAFDEVIIPYRDKLKTAVRRGYSLAVYAGPGTGKTFFISYLLTEAIKRGMTTYYTTLTRFDLDMRAGFRDRETDSRLRYMLNSDFLAIDGINAEKSSDYLYRQFEDLLSRRYDEGMPVLIGSSMDAAAFGEAFGKKVKSLLSGMYAVATLEDKDFRPQQRREMRKTVYGSVARRRRPQRAAKKKPK